MTTHQRPDRAGPVRAASACAATLAVLLLASSPTAGAEKPGRALRDAYYEETLKRLRTAASASDVISTLVARGERAPALGDGESCPVTPPGGIAGVTNPQHYFLSEILPAGIAEDDPACGQALACFLGQMVAHQADPNVNPPSPHSDATLVVDRRCIVQESLVLPNRFVLAGVGTEGRGVLVFDLPDATTAIGFAPSDGAPLRFVTIRDLNIVGSGCCRRHVGVDVSNSSFVYLDRLRIHDFAIGVYGSTAYSIFIDRSDIHNNDINMVLGKETTAWRVRDSVISQSDILGIALAPTARGHLISGARVESNSYAGIQDEGYHNVIENGWFEGNAIGFDHHGIRIMPTASSARILGNLFSSDDVKDQGTDTQLCFNTSGNNCFGK